VNDWSEARTLGDLGILTARWLEGDLAFNPGYGTEESPGPDLDIEDVIPILGRFNRAGFVTDWSQQGEPWEKGGYAQRAHVSGYCDENRAMLIEIVALSADLISVLHSPGDRCASGQIPITLNEGFAYTWERTATSREFLQDVYGPACHPDAVESLASAWQFAILDPVWGRNDLLWDRIADIISQAG
jgi:hypothetical protein